MAERYERGNQEFFSRQPVQDAIADIAKSKELTIYCGAGVTIDLTGLLWRDLIFDMITDKTVVGPDPEISYEDAKALKELIEPLHLASMLAEYNSRHTNNEELALQALHRAIQSRLYNNGQWQSGNLCKNIVRMALALAGEGTPVTIVTSNYDIYLEETFLEVHHKAASQVGFHIYVLNQKKHDRNNPSSKSIDDGSIDIREEIEEKKPSVIPIHSSGTAADVSLVYLHGRVPREGMISGDLVLSEADYSAARLYVESELTRSFRNREVLVLGAGLTDPPLLASLAATTTPIPKKEPAEHNKKEPTEHKRFALLPATSTGILEQAGARFEQLKPHLRARMRQFDLALLIPDFHFQIGQFCEEVLVELSNGTYVNEGNPSHQYYNRLNGWHKSWRKENENKNPKTAFKRLANLQREIETLWRAAMDDRGLPSNRLKVELWVRGDPKEEPRTLALWASSQGILINRTTLSHRQLKIGSESAPVRAFCEGRPYHHMLSDLRPPSADSEVDARWQEFLSVPIFVPFEALPATESSNPTSANLLAGVVTLATMSPKASIPLPQAGTMWSIVELMKNEGFELLIGFKPPQKSEGEIATTDVPQD